MGLFIEANANTMRIQKKMQSNEDKSRPNLWIEFGSCASFSNTIKHLKTFRSNADRMHLQIENEIYLVSIGVRNIMVERPPRDVRLSKEAI